MTLSKSSDPRKFQIFGNSASAGFISLIICIVLTYALSAFIYFTVLIVESSGEDVFYVQGVAVQNITYAIGALLTTYAFIRFLNHRIKRLWLKYAIVAILNFVIIVNLSYVFFIFYWSKMPDSSEGSLTVSYLYTFIPSVVGMVYFYFWTKSKTISETISEQEIQLLQLEQTKTKAQLQALQARINPHFLYNALNSIASLVHEEADTAEEMTLKLSALFRKTTGRNNATYSSLDEELSIVKTYLEIEQIRFGERLSFSTTATQNSLSAKVPSFIIQPLVENAIKHGISKLTTKGEIEVNAESFGNNLVIRVIDNGPAFSVDSDHGYGLGSIQEKLKLLYGQQAKMELINEPQKEVRITLPFQDFTS